MANKTLPPRLAFNDKRGVWEVKYNDGRSRSVSTGTASETEAREFFAGWLRQENAIQAENTDANMRTFDDCWDYYYEGHVQPYVLDPTKLKYVHQALKSHFGGLPICEIDKERVKKYCKDRGVSNGTLHRELAILKACIHYNAEEIDPPHKRLDLRLLPKFRLPKKGAPKDRVLTENEIKALLDNSDPATRIGLYIRLLLGTGSRKTALLELKWKQQIRFDQGLIYLNPTGRLQTNKRRPVVPMTDGLRVVLKDAYERALQQPDENAREYVLGHPGEIRKSVERLTDRLGIERVSSHTFRHTFVTRAIESNVAFAAVAEWVGDRVETIEKNYAHLRPDYLRQEMDKMDVLI